MKRNGGACSACADGRPRLGRAPLSWERPGGDRLGATLEGVPAAGPAFPRYLGRIAPSRAMTRDPVGESHGEGESTRNPVPGVVDAE
jgi:hypothetical protein